MVSSMFQNRWPLGISLLVIGLLQLPRSPLSILWSRGTASADLTAFASSLPVEVKLVMGVAMFPYFIFEALSIFNAICQTEISRKSLAELRGQLFVMERGGKNEFMATVLAEKLTVFYNSVRNRQLGSVRAIHYCARQCDCMAVDGLGIVRSARAAEYNSIGSFQAAPSRLLTISMFGTVVGLATVVGSIRSAGVDLGNGHGAIDVITLRGMAAAFISTASGVLLSVFLSWLLSCVESSKERCVGELENIVNEFVIPISSRNAVTELNASLKSATQAVLLLQTTLDGSRKNVELAANGQRTLVDLLTIYADVMRDAHTTFFGPHDGEEVAFGAKLLDWANGSSAQLQELKQLNDASKVDRVQMMQHLRALKTAIADLEKMLNTRIHLGAQGGGSSGPQKK